MFKMFTIQVWNSEQHLQCTYHCYWAPCVQGETWHCTKVHGSCERNASGCWSRASVSQLKVKCKLMQFDMLGIADTFDYVWTPLIIIPPESKNARNFKVLM